MGAGGRGGRVPAGLARADHAACAAAFLCLAAVPGRDGPGRDPAGPRSCLGGHDHELHPRSRHPYRGCLDRRPAARGRPAGGTVAVKWNLRLAAANRGIWKASELQRMLAEAGLVISAGKMSRLWSGSPASIKPHDLDVICAVVGCGVEELLIAEPARAARTAGRHEAAMAPPPS